MITTYAGDSLLGWLEPGTVRHWYGAPTNPDEIGSKSIDDEPLVDAVEYDGWTAGDDVGMD